MRTPCFLWGAFCVAEIAAAPAWAETSSIPKIWNGEILEADQGAVTLSSRLLDTDLQGQIAPFSFLLKGQKTGLIYSFSTESDDAKGLPKSIWSIKADTYDVMEVSLVDAQGRSLSWKGPYKHSFVAKPKALSLLGTWYLLLMKNGKGFSFGVKTPKNRYRPDQFNGGFRALWDAVNARKLASFGKAEEEKELELRQVIRSTRTIGMQYKLDMFQHNKFAPSVVKVLQTNDADIRSCYTDLLETQEAAQGTLAYTFIYSGETQSIKALKVKGGNMKDARFLECLYYKLLGLTFPLRTSAIGELTFHFKLSE